MKPKICIPIAISNFHVINFYYNALHVLNVKGSYYLTDFIWTSSQAGLDLFAGRFRFADRILFIPDPKRSWTKKSKKKKKKKKKKKNEWMNEDWTCLSFDGYTSLRSEFSGRAVMWNLRWRWDYVRLFPEKVTFAVPIIILAMIHRSHLSLTSKRAIGLANRHVIISSTPPPPNRFT
jgi:hypothetical protein